MSVATVVARRRPNWWKLWPLFPVLIFLTVLFIFPVAQLLWLSLVNDQGGFTGEHYSRLFDSAVYVKVLGITFRIAAWTTLLAIVAGYPVAYLLATATERTRNNLIPMGADALLDELSRAHPSRGWCCSGVGGRSTTGYRPWESPMRP